MEYVKNGMPEEIRDQEKSSLNYQDVIRIAVLYWKWFLLSVIICVGIAAVYLRYTTPVYQATTKMLIKNDVLVATAADLVLCNTDIHSDRIYGTCLQFNKCSIIISDFL